jgi:hypothetical protein
MQRFLSGDIAVFVLLPMVAVVIAVSPQGTLAPWGSVDVSGTGAREPDRFVPFADGEFIWCE